MKKNTKIKIWIATLIIVIIYSLSLAQNNFSSHGGTFPSSFTYILYLFLYVGGFLYLTAVVSVISNIVKSFKIIDSSERNRQVIAKLALLVFLILPAVYYFIFW